MTWRKFPSRYGWNRPATPGWLGFTVTFRLTLLVLIVYTLAANWRG